MLAACGTWCLSAASYSGSDAMSKPLDYTTPVRLARGADRGEPEDSRRVGEPLLCVGEDFVKTDLPLVPRPPSERHEQTFRPRRPLAFSIHLRQEEQDHARERSGEGSQ